MKHILLLLLAAPAFFWASAQPYYPLSGGYLNGSLSIPGGSQIQSPYYGFNAPATQPGNSANVAIFANNNSTAVDFVGWNNGWRFIPNSQASYPSPVVTIDPSGNTFFNGSMGIGINNLSGDKLQVAGNMSIGDNNACQLFFRYGGPGTGGDFTGKQNGADMMSFGFNNEGSFSGTTSSVNGRSIYFYDRVAAIYRANLDGAGTWWFGSSNTNYGLKVVAPGANVTGMSIDASGNVGIGTTATGSSRLTVEGTVAARRVRVTQASPWPDFVFEKNYNLIALDSIESFINQNKHLPELPSAIQVNMEGIDLGDNQAMLLKKVEELTLHLIQMSKTIQQQQAQIDKLQQRIFRKN